MASEGRVERVGAWMLRHPANPLRLPEHEVMRHGLDPEFAELMVGSGTLRYRSVRPKHEFWRTP